MPVARREARGSGGQPPSPARTPAPAPPPRPKKTKKRGRRPRLGLIPLVLILLLVYLLGVPLYHWTKIDKVDAAPERRPPRRPARHQLPHRRLRQGRRPHRRAAQGAADRRARRHQHRHDHRAPHRLRRPHDDVDPPRHPRRGPGRRHADDQRRLRERRRTPAGPAGGGADRHPHRPLRRARVRQRHQHRRRLRRGGDLPEAGHEGPDGAARHQEGLPGGRRPDRAGVLALAPRDGAQRPRPRRPPARGHQRDRRRGALARGPSSTPCATGRSTTPRPARSASTRT